MTIHPKDWLVRKLGSVSWGGAILRQLSAVGFGGSAEYWEGRYAKGGNSGPGSGGRLATMKADFMNTFVVDHGVRSVIEFGCGDGGQLQLHQYPTYIGLDVSPSALAHSRKRFKGDLTKSFILYDPTCFVDSSRLFAADLALSLDVIYHLTEDEIFALYMAHLFDSADRYVIIYSSNTESASSAAHVRHREFQSWITQNRTDWRLLERVPNRYPFDPANPENTSFCDFFVFEKAAS